MPEGTSRLRLTVMASHEPDELRRAASVIATAVRSSTATTADEAAGDPPALPRAA